MLKLYFTFFIKLSPGKECTFIKSKDSNLVYTIWNSLFFPPIQSIFWSLQHISFVILDTMKCKSKRVLLSTFAENLIMCILYVNATFIFIFYLYFLSPLSSISLSLSFWILDYLWRITNNFWNIASTI